MIYLETKALCCGGIPIPEEHPALRVRTKKTALIVAMDRQNRHIVIKTELSLQTIVLLGSTIMCQGRKEPIYGPFLGHLTGKIGIDIFPAGLDLWQWKNAPVSLFDYQSLGDTLTFCEL